MTDGVIAYCGSDLPSDRGCGEVIYEDNCEHLPLCNECWCEEELKRSRALLEIYGGWLQGMAGEYCDVGKMSCGLSEGDYARQDEINGLAESAKKILEKGEGILTDDKNV